MSSGVCRKIVVNELVMPRQKSITHLVRSREYYLLASFRMFGELRNLDHDQT